MLKEDEEQMVLISVVKTNVSLVASGRESDSLSVLALGCGLEFSVFFSCSFKENLYTFPKGMQTNPIVQFKNHIQDERQPGKSHLGSDSL